MKYHVISFGLELDLQGVGPFSIKKIGHFTEISGENLVFHRF